MKQKLQHSLNSIWYKRGENTNLFADTIFEVLKTTNILTRIKKPQSFSSTIKNDTPTNISIILPKETLRDFFTHHQNENHDFNDKKRQNHTYLV